MPMLVPNYPIDLSCPLLPLAFRYYSMASRIRKAILVFKIELVRLQRLLPKPVAGTGTAPAVACPIDARMGMAD